MPQAVLLILVIFGVLKFGGLESCAGGSPLGRDKARESALMEDDHGDHHEATHDAEDHVEVAETDGAEVAEEPEEMEVASSTEPAAEVVEESEPAAETTSSAPAGAAPGAVSGTIKYSGERPGRSIIRMDADANCAAMHQGQKVGTEDAIVGSGGEVENVFVHVKKGWEKLKFPKPSEPAKIDQHGCVYIPHILGVQTGQTLEIISSDNTLHNINCMAELNPKFNFGMPGPGTREKTFRKAEIGIRIKCDVHPWMGAWLHIVDHPFFAITDKSGNYQITGLEPGEYTIEAWHEKFGAVEQKISVGADGAAGVDFTFDPPAKK